jgi:hypothetical protein
MYEPSKGTFSFSWKVGLSLKRWLFRWKGDPSDEKVTFLMKRRLFWWKGDFFQMKSWLFRWKVTFQMKQCLFRWKGDSSDGKWLFRWKGDFSDEKVSCQRTHYLLESEGWEWRVGEAPRNAAYQKIPSKDDKHWIRDFDFGNLLQRSLFCHKFKHWKLLYFLGCSTCWCTAGRYFLAWSRQFLLLLPAEEMTNLHATSSPCGDLGNHVEIH